MEKRLVTKLHTELVDVKNEIEPTFSFQFQA